MSVSQQPDQIRYFNEAMRSLMGCSSKDGEWVFQSITDSAINKLFTTFSRYLFEQKISIKLMPPVCNIEYWQTEEVITIVVIFIGS